MEFLLGTRPELSAGLGRLKPLGNKGTEVVVRHRGRLEGERGHISGGRKTQEEGKGQANTIRVAGVRRSDIQKQRQGGGANGGLCRALGDEEEGPTGQNGQPPGDCRDGKATSDSRV